MSPAGRRTGAIGIAESPETYPVRIMRRPLHSALAVFSYSGRHAAFEGLWSLRATAPRNPLQRLAILIAALHAKGITVGLARSDQW
jgi:uncharacterized ferritin-like protein (DUF455 family)